MKISKPYTLTTETFQNIGSEAVRLYLREPYLFYEKQIDDLINSHSNVLELGAGTGLHTYSLSLKAAKVTATDISQEYLDILLKNALSKKLENITTKIADIENLPFKDKSFDAVVSAGSLSYGDSMKIDLEVRRVLKPGGYFICVDSLNNNPLYYINRFIHVKRKKRKKISFLNMPTIKRIKSISSMYKKTEVKYFGCISFLGPVLIRPFGENFFFKISRKVDRLFKIKRSAFKFVLVAKT